MVHDSKTDIFVSENEKKSWTFKRYTFEIEADGKVITSYVHLFSIAFGHQTYNSFVNFRI